MSVKNWVKEYLKYLWPYLTLKTSQYLKCLDKFGSDASLNSVPRRCLSFWRREGAGKASRELWLAYLACKPIRTRGGNFFRFFLIFLSGLSYSHIPPISVSGPFIFCSCPFYAQLSVLNGKRLVQNDSVLVNLLSEDYRRLYPLALRPKSTKMASEHSYSFLIRDSWSWLNFYALFYILITSFLGRLTAHMTAFIRHYELGSSAPSVLQEHTLNKSKFTLLWIGWPWWPL